MQECLILRGFLDARFIMAERGGILCQASRGLENRNRISVFFASRADIVFMAYPCPIAIALFRRNSSFGQPERACCGGQGVVIFFGMATPVRAPMIGPASAYHYWLLSGVRAAVLCSAAAAVFT
jgi:hypothetical protein